MALNLSTLTGPTSGTVLAEALTTADFLDPVPILKNLSRGSNKGGDAKQTTALNQPKALPLVDGDGYCYLPSVAGNYASIPDSSDLDITGDITLECDFIVPEFPLSANRTLLAKYNINTNARSYTMFLDSSGNIGITLSQDGTFNQNFFKSKNFSLVLSSKTRATVKVTWRQSDGRTQFFVKESDGSFTQVSDNVTIAATSIYNSNAEFEIGSRSSGQSNFGSSLGVFGARIYASVDGTDKRLDVDFTATNVRHGDTKFKCATGQVVTINQSGNDPATIIKKSVLRFDGVNDSLLGSLGTTLTDGYYFAAFSVLGGGGEQFSVIAGLNQTGGNTISTTGYGFSTRDSDNLASFNSLTPLTHTGLYDDVNGDILHEAKFTPTAQSTKVNNADEISVNFTIATSAQEFSIAERIGSGLNAAIDLEYLALFPATITDAEANRVRDFINTRNNVFDLKDGFGYYFYDAQKAPVGAITTGSASWNGRIVGSDNGDTDKYATQGTSNDAPVGDGYVVTFADNTDHLDIPSTTQAGWQVVGTSLGTFAYRVDNDAVTELNLLGNLGHASYRKAGDLYGIILLPESATGADIEQARKLLIDRGAADGSSSTSYLAAWLNRSDIVEFTGVNMSGVVNAQNAWDGCTNMVKFGVTDLSNSNNLSYAWYNTSSLTEFPSGANLGTSASNVAFRFSWQLSGLTSFPALDLSKGNDFTSAWHSCSSLTSFPAGAKLGTSASNVNFESAWRSSGLTSFSTPLPTATSVSAAWLGAPSLSSFDATLPLVSNCNSAWAYCSSLVDFNLASIPEGIYFSQAFRNTGLVDFNTNLPKANTLSLSFKNCASLENFSANVFTNWNPTSLPNAPFNDAWDGCTSLTAQSVENILTSIDASGHYATTNKVSGGPALADAGIDIDYNVATGSLSAATNAAVTSLKAKGWSIIVNNVTL